MVEVSYYTFCEDCRYEEKCKNSGIGCHNHKLYEPVDEENTSTEDNTEKEKEDEEKPLCFCGIEMFVNKVDNKCFKSDKESCNYYWLLVCPACGITRSFDCETYTKEESIKKWNARRMEIINSILRKAVINMLERED